MTTMRTFRSVALALLAALILTVSASAQTALTETTLASAVAAGATSLTLTSATGVADNYGVYVDGELFTVNPTWTSGTLVPVVRRSGVASTHAAGVPVYIAPINAFINRDRYGSCVAAAEEYNPQINVNNGNIWECNSAVKKWINLRDLTVVTCKALLIADQIDQSCFTANRAYVLYRVTYVATTAEAGGTLTIQPKKQVGTTVAASGVSLATAVNAVTSGTAAEVVATLTLTTTEADLIINTGNRIALDYQTDTAGELAGVQFTFYLYPL